MSTVQIISTLYSAMKIKTNYSLSDKRNLMFFFSFHRNEICTIVPLGCHLSYYVPSIVHEMMNRFQYGFHVRSLTFIWHPFTDCCDQYTGELYTESYQAEIVKIGSANKYFLWDLVILFQLKCSTYIIIHVCMLL